MDVFSADMNVALPVEVREIEPGAVHCEPPRSRHVRLRVVEGPAIRVYDPATVVTPDAIETRRSVELVAVATTIEPNPEMTTGVGVGQGGTAEFDGTVIAFADGSDTEAVLDVGIGRIRVNTATTDRPVHVGDFIQLSGPTIHVDSMNPPGQSDADFLAQLDADDQTARREAASYLGHSGSTEAIDPLVERFRAEQQPAVRQAVVAALGRIALTAHRPDEGPDPRIRSTLEAATGDETQRVRTVADEWLNRLEPRW